MKNSPITDPLAWLVAASEGCICPESIDALIALGIEEEMGCSGGRGVLVKTCHGLVFYVPCGYSEWAWANILHIVCVDDYGLSLLKDGLRNRVVVDVGGGFGYFSLTALQLGATRAVVAEPLAAARKIITEGATVLGLEDRILVYPYAVGRRRGRARLYVADNIVNTSLRRSHPLSRGSEIVAEENVPVATLGDLIRAAGGRAALAKIDAEGMEYDIVLGAIEEEALDSVDCITVESHDMHVHKLLKGLLGKAGFTLLHEKLDKEFNQYFLAACHG